MDYLVTQDRLSKLVSFLDQFKKIFEIISDTYFTVGKKRSPS